MKSKVATLVAVAAAVAAIVILKGNWRGEPLGVTEMAHAPAAEATVMLFADPREAESSCGCAEIIRLARMAGQQPGVRFREFDTRHSNAEVRERRIRVSPTVLILGQDGQETQRFEGESGAVITRLRAAVDELGGRISTPAAP